jgi:hypothetical protein
MSEMVLVSKTGSWMEIAKRSGAELAICNGAPALELDLGNTLVGCSVQGTEGREAKHRQGEGALRREVQPNKIL